MKIWLENCLNYTTISDCPVKLGLDWHKHRSIESKLFKNWNGFSMVLHFFKWSITLNWVDDYEAYDYKMNFRYMRKK